MTVRPAARLLTNFELTISSRMISQHISNHLQHLPVFEAPLFVQPFIRTATQRSADAPRKPTEP